MNGLELQGVVKRFGEVTVVQQLDLAVHEGEFVVLLGESGCGKSTTLRMIAGLEDVTEGRIRIANKDVTHLHPMARDIAMVFQNYALYPHLNVAQNLSFALHLAGRPQAEIDSKVAKAAQVLNIEHLLQRKPKELSGGQRQRVAIGRAIVREPKVFLFDEPLSNLDAKLRGHMRAELALLHERLAKTTVYVTHDQVEAMTLANRIVIFDKGRIQQVGTPGEVFKHPANLFVAAFIGTPTMNLLPARAVHEGGQLRLRGDGFEFDAPPWLAQAAEPVAEGRALMVGFRPQAPTVAGASGAAAHLRLQVKVCEYLGTESQLVGTLEGSSQSTGARLTVTVPGDAHAQLHSELALHVAPEQLHVFDAASGLSLRTYPLNYPYTTRRPRMNRRDLIKGASITVFGAGLPFSGAQAQNRYAKYAGKTVVFSVPAHPHYDAMMKILPDFTKETGIKVETDKLAMGRMKEKQLLEMAKPSGDFDLGCYVVMWKGEYVAKNLIQPLEPFFANPALADPAYDRQDIVPIYLENLGLVGGPKGYLAGPGAKLYGLPYGAETSVLAYRRDIFAKHNLKVPETYDDFKKLLRTIKEKEGIGALASRGQAGHQVVHAWLLHLNPLGGSVFDEQWKPRFNDKVGVEALKFLQEVVATGPAGIPGYGQGESNTAFLQGQAAMYLDSTSLAGLVNDPSKSRVVGNVSWALHPKGVRRASQSGGLGLAIPKNAKNAEAGFLLMQWLTSKAQDKAVTMAGGAPMRNSTLRDVDAVRKYPEFITFVEALKYSAPDWRPIIPVWDKINVQALGVGLSEALTGKKSAEQALNDLVPQVTAIMREGGYKV